ncbi:MAG: SOS response-associated peptidase [Pirellulales bacterium]
MCGRFTLRTPASVLIAHFDLEVRAEQQLELFKPRYNIAPTQEIVVVRADPTDRRRTVTTLRWGLVPSWSKEPLGGPPQINARAETLADKPTFRTAFRRRRCLIPADGFYEWQQAASGGRGKKQPFYIHRPDNAPFAFAGLWEAWTARSGPALPGDAVAPLSIESCTIVTTAANERLRELHERMPVVLAPADYGLWLDPHVEEPASLAHLLAPCGPAELVAEPVSTHVNRVANDGPQCIAPERALFE